MVKVEKIILEKKPTTKLTPDLYMPIDTIWKKSYGTAGYQDKGNVPEAKR